jgi:hypothetical protein
MNVYRVGNQVGRTIYRDNELIGIMDERSDAALVVELLNDHRAKNELVEAFKRMEKNVVGALEDLQAADLILDDEVTALIDEQATFLTNVAAALAAAGTNPEALAAVTADLNAQAQKLTSLAEAQKAADPGPQA